MDLNCLLYRLEATLGKYHKLLGQDVQGAQFVALANRRKEAINRYFGLLSKTIILIINLNNNNLYLCAP